VNFESRFGEDSASGQYNPSYNTGAYNGNNGAYNGNGAYNTNPASYNTAAAVNTNTGYGFVRKTKLAAEEREKSQLREVLMLLKRMNHWA